MGFLTFLPTSGDTDNILLQKIVQVLAAGGGALTMGFLKVLPTSGDTDNILLQKIVQILAGPTGSGGGVFIAAIGGSATNLTLVGTTVFSGCVGSDISFCPDDTWGIGVAGARPNYIDVSSTYKYDGVDVIIANTTLFNFFFGSAGNLTMTGDENTATGYQAFSSNTSGNNNIAYGFQSLFSNTSGFRNVALGHTVLFSNTTGNSNMAVGFETLASNTIGSENAAIGARSLRNNVSGSLNTAVGANSLFELTAAVGTGANTAIGYNSGRGITTGVNNTIIGANVTGLAAALSNNIIIADGSGNQRIQVASTGAVTIPISLRLNGPLIIPTGANARAGNAVLVAGTVTVANTSVTANTVIMLTRKTIGGVVGNTSYTVIAGTSFTITSSNIADTSTMSYFLIENP